MQKMIIINPGFASLADWRYVYSGAGAHLSGKGRQAVAAAANEVTRCQFHLTTAFAPSNRDRIAEVCKWLIAGV